ncbi:hypothetical protein [Halobacillus litoralis]|uniref:Uncharacterized protein n=1 Tax=Halobacillus litoralis TaxID=45668 RepID=A0A410MJ64_9BACI|nr:hypothetical protein [Halobacillus litoralis]QAS54767.1 hypothetical protein HLI_21150 [Halobacillus litoralis]
MKRNNIIQPEDLRWIHTDKEKAIALVKKYAPKYDSKQHWEALGSSCGISATKMVGTITNSSKHLKGDYLLPDEIHLERLVEWFLSHNDYDCDQPTLTYYLAHFLKREINQFYRDVIRGAVSFSNFSVDPTFRRKYKRDINKRNKIIRQ